MLKYLTTSVFLSIFCLHSFAQNHAIIDSLLKELITAQEDTSKVKILYKLCDEYSSNAIDTAHKYCEQALKLAKQLNFQDGIAKSLHLIGTVYFYQSDYEKSEEYYRQSLIVYEQIGEKNPVGRILGNIGLVYMNQGNYEKALDHFLQAMKIYEETSNKNGMAYQYNNIARIPTKPLIT